MMTENEGSALSEGRGRVSEQAEMRLSRPLSLPFYRQQAIDERKSSGLCPQSLLVHNGSACKYPLIPPLIPFSSHPIFLFFSNE